MKWEEIKQKLKVFWEKCKPVLQKIGEVFQQMGHILALAGKWIFKLRGLLLSIPVFVAAIGMGIYNMRMLPEEVGFSLTATGEYAYMISRNMAVFGPLAVTGVCLLLVCCSRRVVYPWLISLFSLVLPVFLYVTNVLI